MSNDRPVAKRAFLYVLAYKRRYKRDDWDSSRVGIAMMARGESKLDLLDRLLAELKIEYPGSAFVVTSFTCELDRADWPETGSACRYRNLFDKD